MDYLLDYMRAYPIEEFVGKTSRDGYVDVHHVTKPWYWGVLPHRIETVTETLLLIRKYPEVSDEELLQILQRVYEETAFLLMQISWEVERGHNGAPGQIRAVAAACAILRDFAAAEQWMEYDVQMLSRFIEKAFYPDGWYKEIATPYSVSVARQIQILAQTLSKTVDLSAMRNRLTAMVTSLVGTSSPNGVIPTFGDNCLGKPLSYYIDRDLARGLDLPWLKPIIDGTDGPRPPFTVWPVPGQEQWCGYYTMRSSWRPDAKFMMLDCGPWGLCHCHGDRLSFVLMAHGTYFIIDPYGTRYTSTNPTDFISRQEPGFLHNTITVDGVDEFGTGFWETDKPLSNTWQHGADYTLFEGSFSFAPIKPMEWTRRILFVDKSYWLLQDVLTGDLGSAAIEQNFQFEHDIKIQFRDRMTLATAPNGAKLALVPLTGELKPELTVGDKAPHTTHWVYGRPKTKAWGEKATKQSHGRGWTAYRMQYLMPAPAVTYVGHVELPAMVTVALVPLAPAEDLAGMVEVRSQRAAAETVWTLPTAKAPLRFVTSSETCEVLAR